MNNNTTTKEKVILSYSIEAKSIAEGDGAVNIRTSNIPFGTTEITAKVLPSPAELYIAAFASCILKNVERFSKILKFQYENASVEVRADRLERPARMENIEYELKIYSNDPSLNVELLKRNIEKFGTIYNSVNSACKVAGNILKINN